MRAIYVDILLLYFNIMTVNVDKPIFTKPVVIIKENAQIPRLIIAKSIIIFVIYFISL